MSLTVLIVWRYILPRVRVSVRPSNCVYARNTHNYREYESTARVFIWTRQFTRATHCSLSITKIIWLFNRKGNTKQFCIVGCYTQYKLICYVLIPHIFNPWRYKLKLSPFCQQLSPFMVSPFRRAADDQPWPQYVVAAQFIPADRWRWTMTAVTGVTGSIQLTTRAGDAVFAIVWIQTW